jgi:hypothetical protein
MPSSGTYVHSNDNDDDSIMSNIHYDMNDAEKQGQHILGP